MANPTAMLLSSCNMLNHVGLEYYGNMIQSAVKRVLKAGKVTNYCNEYCTYFSKVFLMPFNCRLGLRILVANHLPMNSPWPSSITFVINLAKPGSKRGQEKWLNTKSLRDNNVVSFSYSLRF